jgi:hypothetical protein
MKLAPQFLKRDMLGWDHVSQAAPYECNAPDSPYKDYNCLDTYLGDGFFERLINYYRLEWGHEIRSTSSRLMALLDRSSGQRQRSSRGRRS